VAGRQVVGGRIARFLVLDTNVLVSGLGWGGHPAQLLDAALEGHLTLVTSPALLEEVWRVLRYPRLTPHLAVEPYELLRLIVGASVVVAPSRTITVAPDPDFETVELCPFAGLLVSWPPVARVKTTTYIDERLRRAAKAAAVRSGLKEYEVYEQALRKYLGWDVLDKLLASHSDLSEDEAMRIALEEVHQTRAQRAATREA
jgi:putative PIN family toxin of toxin-antitoxin system